MQRSNVLVQRAGLSEVVYTDTDRPGMLFTHVEEKIQPLRDAAIELRHAQEARTKAELAGCRVRAVIPMAVHLTADREKWDTKKWRQWLADPDNSALIVAGKGLTDGGR